MHSYFRIKTGLFLIICFVVINSNVEAGSLINGAKQNKSGYFNNDNKQNTLWGKQTSRRSRTTENYLNTHPRLKRHLKIELTPPENGFDSSWLPFDGWSLSQKNRLERFYQLMLQGDDLPLPNDISLAPLQVDGEELFRDSVLAYASTDLAMDVYLAQIAHLIYLDREVLVPWELEDYSDEELSYLFLSSNYFKAARGSDNKIYYIVDRISYSQTTENILGDPRQIYEFLAHQEILGEDQENTLKNLSVWFQNNLFHWANAPKTEFYRNHPYLNDRIRTLETPDQGEVIVAIGGCWSASRLFADLMRVLNVPIQKMHNNLMHQNGDEGHHSGLAFRWRDGNNARYLIHSDNLYSQTSFYDPMPADDDVSRVMGNYLWLNPNNFSEFFDYDHGQNDFFAVQTWEQWERYWRYASIGLSSYLGLSVFGGLTEEEIIDILLNNYDIDESLAEDAAHNFILSWTEFDAENENVFDTIDERHQLWRDATGK